MTTLTLPPPLVPRTAAREQRPIGYSPEDLLIMPDGERYELVNGQLQEKPMSGLSSWVGAEAARRLGNFVVEHDLGWVFGSDAGFQCFPDALEKVRKPDASFVAKHKLPGGPVDGHLRVAPDIAVEVSSPNDSLRDADDKVEEYLAAGVRSVWLINPKTRVVQVIRSTGTIQRLRDSDELSEPDILPGFVCHVRDLLPAAAPVLSEATKQ
jgi:Uma2 family endonuclease